MRNKQYNQSQLSNQIFLTRGRAYKKKNGLKVQKASKNPKAVFTPKPFEEIVPQLSWESQKQYETLRLYCQEDSLVKLSRRLDSLLKSGSYLKPILGNKSEPPSSRTLDRWCKKFDWVQRKDNWVAEECRFAFFSMTVKLHQNTTKTPPEMTVKRGQMSANEGSFQGNDGDFGANRGKSGRKMTATGDQKRPNATKIKGY